MTKTHPLLITLSHQSIPGGLEAYTHYLLRAFPSLDVWDRSTLVRRSLPVIHDIQVGENAAKKITNMQEKPSVVLANGLHGWAFSPRSRFPPLIGIFHGTYSGLAERAYSASDPVYWKMNYFLAPAEKKSAKNATICVANSPFTQLELKSKYGVESRVIEPPIDEKIFAPLSKSRAQKKLGWSANTKHVLFVGNPTHSKGFDLFVELARAHSEWIFHAVCQPVPRASERNFPSNLKLYSAKPQKELASFYSAADALVFPSRYEGFGFVPLEATACGCRVIASRVGILNDFSHPSIRVVSHSFHEFERALVETLSSPSPKKTSRAWMKRFSISTFITKWNAIANEIQGENSK